jgi:hypothetical protein
VNMIPMMLLAVTTLSNQPAQAPATEPTAGEAYKNIKVLKDMPASQLMPVMHLMRSALGTRCDFCHVAEGNQYELDTKKEKETARAMIRMVFAINKENFEGQARVTCNTCHRGQEHPVHVPPIGQAQFDDTTHGSDHHGPQEALPSAAEVLDRYIQALGGRAALEGIKSRVSRGTLLRMKVIGSGTPKAQAVNRGQEDPFEIALQAPDRATVTVGETVLRLDGASGTVKTPRGERPLPPQEVARMAENIDLRGPLKLRDRADKARVLRKESIEGKETLVLRIREEDGTSRLYYFDTATGLLLRQVINRPTVLGPDPEQTDYEDYRAVGAVKVPFLIKSSFLDDNHLGTTRKVVEVRDNE